MRPYVPPLVDSKLIRTFNSVKELVEFIVSFSERPYQTDDGRSFTPSSHHLAHVVAIEIPGLSVVDGHFMDSYAHSWLATEEPDFIIDVYPQAAYPGPWIVCVEGPSPWRKAYSAERKPEAVDKPDFEQEVRMIYDRFRGAHAFLSMP